MDVISATHIHDLDFLVYIRLEACVAY